MALVVLLRGINVGGRKIVRPKMLADDLRHLDVVNIGAAGTFVVREPVTRRQLRESVARRLPFEAEIVICQGRDITSLVSRDFFARCPVRPDIVRFVSVLSRLPGSLPRLPVNLPSRAAWVVRLLARDGPFVVGVYRRRMTAIRHLGTLDRIFGVPLTTRNWNTMAAIARVLDRTRR